MFEPRTIRSFTLKMGFAKSEQVVFIQNSKRAPFHASDAALFLLKKNCSSFCLERSVLRFAKSYYLSFELLRFKKIFVIRIRKRHDKVFIIDPISIIEISTFVIAGRGKSGFQLLCTIWLTGPK